MFPRLTAATMSAVAIVGCDGSPRDIGPDAYELANMDPDNAVPDSSPNVLVRTMAIFCLDRINDPATRPVALRAAGFVPLTRETGDKVTSFVSDDSRPMVMLSHVGATVTCAVAAESRTGQTARVERLVAETYPQATRIDPARISPNTESAWLVDANGSTILFTSRFGTLSTPSEYVVAISRTQPAQTIGPT